MVVTYKRAVVMESALIRFNSSLPLMLHKIVYTLILIVIYPFVCIVVYVRNNITMTVYNQKRLYTDRDIISIGNCLLHQYDHQRQYIPNWRLMERYMYKC